MALCLPNVAPRGCVLTVVAFCICRLGGGAGGGSLSSLFYIFPPCGCTCQEMESGQSTQTASALRLYTPCCPDFISDFAFRMEIF